jgi:hypothetical protein
MQNPWEDLFEYIIDGEPDREGVVRRCAAVMADLHHHVLPPQLEPLDKEDQLLFMKDLKAALLQLKANGDPELREVSRVLKEWRATAEALSDPASREVLLKRYHLGDDVLQDFLEASPPQD